LKAAEAAVAGKGLQGIKKLPADLSVLPAAADGGCFAFSEKGEEFESYNLVKISQNGFFISGVDAAAEDDPVAVAGCLYAVRKYMLVLPLVEPAALRVHCADFPVLLFLLPSLLLPEYILIWYPLYCCHSLPF